MTGGISTIPYNHSFNHSALLLIIFSMISIWTWSDRWYYWTHCQITLITIVIRNPWSSSVIKLYMLVMITIITIMKIKIITIITIMKITIIRIITIVIITIIRMITNVDQLIIIFTFLPSQVKLSHWYHIIDAGDHHNHHHNQKIRIIRIITIMKIVRIITNVEYQDHLDHHHDENRDYQDHHQRWSSPLCRRLRWNDPTYWTANPCIAIFSQ